MTDKQTPPDWVLLEAAKRWSVDMPIPASAAYMYRNHPGYRALCDMIAKYEQPPVTPEEAFCAAVADYGRGDFVGIDTLHKALLVCGLRLVKEDRDL